jgi:hypothetical protein
MGFISPDALGLNAAHAAIRRPFDQRQRLVSKSTRNGRRLSAGFLPAVPPDMRQNHLRLTLFPNHFNIFD